MRRKIKRGVERAIGVLEMHEYFLLEAKLNNRSKYALFASFIEKIKENTCALTHSQVGKIMRQRDEIYEISIGLMLHKCYRKLERMLIGHGTKLCWSSAWNWLLNFLQKKRKIVFKGESIRLSS